VHTDIAETGWTARLSPKARAYARLARLDRPIGSWLLFLPGAWGILLGRAAPAETLRLLVLFAIGSVAMRSAGCVVNDLWDRDIDRRVARTAGRPLASGALRAREALWFLVLLLAVSLSVLVALRPVCWAMAAGSLVLVGLYPLAKRVTWWPQLVLGLPFGFGAPMGYVAVTGRIDGACAALYAAAILWDLGFDTIYGFQDIEDDAVVGVRSTSRRFAHRARLFVGVAYAGTIVCLAVALAAGSAPVWSLALLAVPAWLLARQVSGLDTGSPARCLTLFRSNRLVGITVAVVILAALARW
jgi:4-hydroxybenzoate polyprenyltransferase